MAHELDISAQKAAIEALIEFAQIGRGYGIVLERGMLPEMGIPEGDAFFGIGVAAESLRMCRAEAIQRGAGHLEEREDTVGRPAFVERPEPFNGLVEMRLVCKRLHAPYPSRSARMFLTLIAMDSSGGIWVVSSSTM